MNLKNLILNKHSIILYIETAKLRNSYNKDK